MKLKALLVSILAMLAVSAVGATTASAAFALSSEECNEGLVSFCWDVAEPGTLLRELKGKEAATATVTKPTLLEAAVAGGPIHFECLKAKLGAGSEVDQEKPLAEVALVKVTSLETSECKMVKPLNCEVTPEIKTKAIVGDPVSETDEAQGVVFKPSVGTLFVEVKFSGAECLIKGNQQINGEQVCLWLTPLEDLLGQELLCAHTESNLTFGASKVKATFEGELLVRLPTLEAAGDFWDITQA